ncbi:hypothetical protein C8Q74DRAFT_131175 [Fomes fomentarius]|nr:hypothetical protein C8Q74DRAFT_131175 [Fomes fomentarius]
MIRVPERVHFRGSVFHLIRCMCHRNSASAAVRTTTNQKTSSRATGSCSESVDISSAERTRAPYSVLSSTFLHTMSRTQRCTTLDPAPTGAPPDPHRQQSHPTAKFNYYLAPAKHSSTDRYPGGATLNAEGIL